MASLVHLLPDEYTSTMQVLQNEVTPSSFTEIDSVFRKEIGISMLEYCDSVDPVAIGVASLAQVYKGVKDGKEVAIKVYCEDLH